MYLPNSTAPGAELNLNMLSMAKGMAIIKDEASRGKWGRARFPYRLVEFRYLEVLSGLMGASDRLRGVGAGRRSVAPFNAARTLRGPRRRADFGDAVACRPNPILRVDVCLFPPPSLGGSGYPIPSLPARQVGEVVYETPHQSTPIVSSSE